jgi:hypothetical protein
MLERLFDRRGQKWSAGPGVVSASRRPPPRPPPPDPARGRPQEGPQDGEHQPPPHRDSIMTRSAVTTSDRSNEPRQPRRLLKKKNTATACPASLRLMHRRVDRGRDVAHADADAAFCERPRRTPPGKGGTAGVSGHRRFREEHNPANRTEPHVNAKVCSSIPQMRGGEIPPYGGTRAHRPRSPRGSGTVSCFALEAAPSCPDRGLLGSPQRMRRRKRCAPGPSRRQWRALRRGCPAGAPTAAPEPVVRRSAGRRGRAG